MRKLWSVSVSILALGAGAYAQVPARQPVPPTVQTRSDVAADILPAESARLIRSGDSAMARADLSGAVASYVRAAQAAPDALLPRLLAGVALTSSQRLTLAANSFKEAHRLAESDLLTTFMLIGALEAVGDQAAAQELYLQTARDPRFHTAGRPGFDASSSIAYLKQAAAAFPGSPTIALLIGDAEQLMGSFPQAEAAYRQSLKLAPKWVKPRLSLARVQIAQGQSQRAVETVEAALREDPDNVPAQIAKGEALVRAGKPKEAILTVQKLEHIDSATVLNILARANLSQGKLNAAENYADRAQKSSPRDPNASVMQGVVRSKQGDYSGAASAYTQALKLTRESGLFDAQPSLFRALTEAQLSAGRPADALSTLREAAEQEPDLVPIWERLSAQAHESLGDSTAMEEDLRQALEAEQGLNPQETLQAINKRGLIEKEIAYYVTQLSIARTGVGANASTGVSITGGTPSKANEIRCLAALGYLYRFSDDAPNEVDVRRDLCQLRGTGVDWFLLAEAQEHKIERRDALTSYQQALSKGGLTRVAWERAKARIKALESRPQ
ncbi:MAG: tetratricopeptide repeat protein [Armatimonas sp.]